MDVSELDNDLQKLVHAYTYEDLVIYQRAVKLYEEQKSWTT
jgi:hypothetical protein